MAHYDWSRFTKKIPVYAGADAVYRWWCEPGRLEYWFLRKAVFISPGGIQRAPNEPVQEEDTYVWMWHGYGDEVAEQGKVLEANGSSLFKFVFGKAGIVTVEIQPAGSASMVQLTQEQIPVEEEFKVKFHLGCMEGWTFYLANLKSLLEGGIDLRNRDPMLQGVVNS